MKYFSVAAIFKHEEPYIGDWVKYHLGLGVEHIYLYDNDSPDKSARIAKEVGGDRVSIEPCPGSPAQKVAYHRCLASHKMETRWLAFLDIDEYLVTYAPVNEVLHAYERHPALCPHWILFGSNGRLVYTPEPVPVRFTRSQLGVNPHVKSIVNPVLTGEWITPHRFTHPNSPVDENHNPITMQDSIPPNGTADVIYVAHYSTKSKQECLERRNRPRSDTGGFHCEAEVFFTVHDVNERENLDVLNIWNRI